MPKEESKSARRWAFELWELQHLKHKRETKVWLKSMLSRSRRRAPVAVPEGPTDYQRAWAFFRTNSRGLEIQVVDEGPGGLPGWYDHLVERYLLLWAREHRPDVEPVLRAFIRANDVLVDVANGVIDLGDEAETTYIALKQRLVDETLHEALDGVVLPRVVPASVLEDWKP